MWVPSKHAFELKFIYNNNLKQIYSNKICNDRHISILLELFSAVYTEELKLEQNMFVSTDSTWMN